jgi:hypothetical protein
MRNPPSIHNNLRKAAVSFITGKNLFQSFSLTGLKSMCLIYCAKVKNTGPEGLTSVCPWKGALHDSALFNKLLLETVTGRADYL